MSKAADAFRTISEVGTELAVPKHVLRFWEAKFPQIRPMKRGGGRRYYRPSDMELLRGIRHLLHAEGYTIKGVQKILREQGIDAVKHFGREDLPPRQPATRGGRPVPRPGRAPEGAAPPPPAKATVTETVNTADILKRMLSELEACRALLVTEAPAAQTASRGAKRPRAARG